MLFPAFRINSIILLLSFFTVQTLYSAENNVLDEDYCSKYQPKSQEYFKKFIIQNYKKKGLTIPKWRDPYFETKYTFNKEWLDVANKYYDAFAKEFNIPLTWFVFKIFKKHDLATLWDTRGEMNFCDLALDWLKLADILDRAYPEIANWIRNKIKHPKKKLPLPASSFEKDLKFLLKGEPDESRFNLVIYSDEDFINQLIDYAVRMKELYAEINR